MRILVVEDNDLVADAITMGLGAAGFAVDRSASAESASNALATEHFDLLVVDVGLPGEDGLSLVRRLRSRGATQPVLILTARDTLAIKVEALNLGADDFLLKPFEQDELVARCRALIRRANLYAGEQVNLGRLRLDVAGRMLRIDETPGGTHGARMAGAGMPRVERRTGRLQERLQQAIATFDQALTPNAVEVYVSRVRAKLGEAAVIRTVRGLGYRLEEPHG